MKNPLLVTSAPSPISSRTLLRPKSSPSPKPSAQKPKTYQLRLLRGAGGVLGLYLDHHRLSKEKPQGLLTVVTEWTVSREELEDALR